MPQVRKPWSKVRGWEFARRPIALSPPWLRPILEEFLDWLRTHRGMLPGSIRVRLTSTRDFLLRITAAGPPEDAVAALEPLALERFFVAYSCVSGPSACRNMRSAVRRFLQFAAERGLVDRTLADAVPSYSAPRLARVVPSISETQIRKLLESLEGDKPSHIRNRAIFVILASYGVRRGQICLLQLEDVRWRDRLIKFASHKGGKAVVQPLLDEVADALARYLTEVRPRIEHREVFLRIQRPFCPLGPGAISELVRQYLKRAGIECAAWGPHLFRHAFATRQLKYGRSLKEVADQLGHRHFASAAIYTKVDQPALREVALEWPEVLR